MNCYVLIGPDFSFKYVWGLGLMSINLDLHCNISQTF